MTIDNMACFECGNPAQELHHVVPRVVGGTKIVPLCSTCHGLIHIGRKGRGNVSELSKIGIAKARERGVVMGRPKCYTKEDLVQIRAWWRGNVSQAEIARRLNISRQSVIRALKEIYQTKDLSTVDDGRPIKFGSFIFE